MEIHHVLGNAQVVYTLIKPLGNATFNDLCIKLQVTSSVSHWSCGGVLEEM